MTEDLDFCIYCGTQTNKDDLICPKCGKKLVKISSNQNNKNYTSKSKYSKTNEYADEYRQSEHVSIEKYEKSTFVAILASVLFVGTGQYYNGQMLKGTIFIIINFLLNLVSMWLSLFWLLYTAYDAYKSAKHINENNGNYFYNDEDLNNSTKITDKFKIADAKFSSYFHKIDPSTKIKKVSWISTLGLWLFVVFGLTAILILALGPEYVMKNYYY